MLVIMFIYMTRHYCQFSEHFTVEPTKIQLLWPRICILLVLVYTYRLYAFVCIHISIYVHIHFYIHIHEYVRMTCTPPTMPNDSIQSQ